LPGFLLAAAVAGPSGGLFGAAKIRWQMAIAVDPYPA
jgi:hypothetical protein